jgi:hypothetical protein
MNTIERPMQPIRSFLARDRGVPSHLDYQQARLCESGGSVIKPDALCGHFLGLASDFGIVGRAYDAKTKIMLKGRFLVQDAPLSALEIIHHTYFLKVEK